MPKLPFESGGRICPFTSHDPDGNPDFCRRKSCLLNNIPDCVLESLKISAEAYSIDQLENEEEQASRTSDVPPFLISLRLGRELFEIQQEIDNTTRQLRINRDQFISSLPQQLRPLTYSHPKSSEERTA